jgi:class 3 adenylate cyclase
VADVLHEVYHVARSYTDPRVAESEHYFEHKNKVLEALLRLDQGFTDAHKEQTSLKLRLDNIERERSALRHQLQELQGTGPEGNGLVKRECALLVTDLQGSSRMVGFLDKDESTEILRDYAAQVQSVILEHGGKVEKFTGDGIFAYFEADEENRTEVVRRACEAAAQIHLKTNRFFKLGKVTSVLLRSGGIKISGCRTVLHYGDVVHTSIAGARSVVGPQVVAAFRASTKKDLFEDCSTVLSEPFYHFLGGVDQRKPVATAVKLDDNLPPMSFYAHPDLGKAS